MIGNEIVLCRLLLSQWEGVSNTVVTSDPSGPIAIKITNTDSSWYNSNKIFTFDSLS